MHGFVNKYAFIISVSSANLNNGVTPPMMMYPPLAIIYYFGSILIARFESHSSFFYELDTYLEISFIRKGDISLYDYSKTN